MAVGGIQLLRGCLLRAGSRPRYPRYLPGAFTSAEPANQEGGGTPASRPEVAICIL